MSDFDDWQKLWTENKAPLPEISKIARRQHRGLIIANVFFWPISALELAVAAIALSHYDEASSVSIGLAVLVGVFAMGTFFFRMQRGLWREAIETPPQTLERLQRHERSMRRAAWVGALAFLGASLFVLAHTVLDTPPDELRAALATPLVLLALSIATVVLWPRFIGKHADKLRDQIARFKEQLEV